MKTFPALPLIVLLTVASPLAPHAAAEEEVRYVADTLIIPLRRAPGNQQDIVVNNLPSGTKLVFVREETDANRNKWSLVRTENGVSGWARSQHLLSEPTAALKLAELEETHAATLQELETLRQARNRAQDLEAEHQRVHESYQLLQTRADFLQAENDQLKNSDRYSQWIYGGGLLLVGVLLSFILQAFGRRRRQSDWR